MNKPISNVELLRMVLACFAAYSLWSFAGGFVVQRLGPIETESDLVLVIALGGVLPPFLSVVTACLLPPWRTKTIAATIMLMCVAVIALVDLALSLGGWESALWSVVRMSVAMTVALVGVLTWRGLKKRHHERPPSPAVSSSESP